MMLYCAAFLALVFATSLPHGFGQLGLLILGFTVGCCRAFWDGLKDPTKDVQRARELLRDLRANHPDSSISVSQMKSGEETQALWGRADDLVLDLSRRYPPSDYGKF